MTGIVERLGEFMKSKAIDGQGLADILGYKSPEKINRLFRDKDANPSVGIVSDIANKFAELDVSWLLTGRKIDKQQAITTEKISDVALETLHKLAIANEKLADANQRQTIMLEKERSIAVAPKQSFPVALPNFGKLLELISVAVTDKSMKTAEEVQSFLNRVYLDEPR